MEVLTYLNGTGLSSAGKGANGWGAKRCHGAYILQGLGVWVRSFGGNLQSLAGWRIAEENFFPYIPPRGYVDSKPPIHNHQTARAHGQTFSLELERCYHRHFFRIEDSGAFKRFCFKYLFCFVLFWLPRGIWNFQARDQLWAAILTHATAAAITVETPDP